MPYLTPDSVPEDDICRPLLIPASSQWLAIISGALTELTKSWNWEESGITVDEAIQAVWTILDSYYNTECAGSGGCRRIYRIGQGGQIQMSDDAGETWESAATEIPPTPPRTEPTEEDRLCAAASNAVNVLHQTYEEMIDAWQLDNSVEFGIGAFAAILALLVGNWLGVVSAIAIPFVWELFGGVYATIGTFLQDAWDSDFTDALTCLFLEAATDTGGVITFDWNAISQGLADRVTETAAPEDALLWAQLNYMVLFIGIEGLNAAGATTGVVGDCPCDIEPIVLQIARPNFGTTLTAIGDNYWQVSSTRPSNDTWALVNSVDCRQWKITDITLILGTAPAGNWRQTNCALDQWEGTLNTNGQTSTGFGWSRAGNFPFTVQFHAEAME